MKNRYKRILLKLSGEGLMGNKPCGIDDDVLNMFVNSIKKVYDKGVSLCIVIGGGNFYRGVNNTNKAVPRSVADQAGMLATVINALFLKSALVDKGIPTEVLSGLYVPQAVLNYSFSETDKLLKEKKLIIFAGGTGNPYFTTDTGATLRALESNCDALLKATQVDGVYDSDPKKNPKAIRYDEITYDEVIAKNLKVMDMTAISMARENKLPIIVFKHENENSLLNVLNGKGKYTIIK